MPQSIMIIGAGPCIGQAVAEKFGREGWTVVLTGRNADRVSAQAAGLSARGLQAHAIPADATDPVALRAAMAEAERLTGGLSVVHYNAAVLRRQDLFELTHDEVTSDLAINIAGGLHTIRAAVAQFGTRGGTILVTGGSLGISPNAAFVGLGAGKAALRNIVQGLAEPLGQRGIRIAIATVATLVGPGSDKARGVAETFWSLATEADAPWEAMYPAR